jgi:hypothetical protein
MERNGDYTEKWSHCVPFVFNKLRDKKYLVFKVFIWLTYVLFHQDGVENFSLFFVPKVNADERGNTSAACYYTNVIIPHTSQWPLLASLQLKTSAATYPLRHIALDWIISRKFEKCCTFSCHLKAKSLTKRLACVVLWIMCIEDTCIVKGDPRQRRMI